jgi:hypothetical protein
LQIPALHSHYAIIEDIGFLDAISLPGARYITTGKELRIKYGAPLISRDETAMAVEKVRYIR